ncbi:MAG: hypothetical protein AAGB26_12260 [Planctomycetota bacterium]
MDYQFREIRKHESADVLVFAKTQGCAPEPGQLRHHLSLTVKLAGELAAVALCLENEPGRYVVEIVHTEGFGEGLITELADRCLRKVQSEGIASARVKSPIEASTKSLWKQTNWLDRIEETPPPGRPPEEPLEGEAASQVA